MSEFNCENDSIRSKIEWGYYATVLKRGYAYEICLEDKVIGHYMLMVSPLELDDGYFAGPVSTGYAAIKIDYLAIDALYQRNGHGTSVLKYITQLASKFSKELPIRFLSLDALRGKAKWYFDRGFEYYNKEDLKSGSDTISMYMDFQDRKAVEKYCASLE